METNETRVYDIHSLDILSDVDDDMEIEARFRITGARQSGFAGFKVNLNPDYILGFLFPDDDIHKIYIKDYIYQDGLRVSVEETDPVLSEDFSNLDFDRSSLRVYRKNVVKSEDVELSGLLEVRTSVSTEITEKLPKSFNRSNYNLIRFKERYSVKKRYNEVHITKLKSIMKRGSCQNILEIEVESTNNKKFSDEFNEIVNEIFNYLDLHYDVMYYYANIMSKNSINNEGIFSFPFQGQMPVSMMGNEELSPEYTIKQKFDGERVHFIVFEGKVHFLHRNGLQISNDFEVNIEDVMIVDGEMIFHSDDVKIIGAKDRKTKSKPSRVSFVVFDFLDYDHDQLLRTKEYLARYRILAGNIKDIEITDVFTKEKFQFSLSPLILPEEMPEEYSDHGRIIENRNGKLIKLSVPIDGYILQKKNDFYISGRDDTLLKWKDPSELTVDLRMRYDQKKKMFSLNYLTASREEKIAEIEPEEGMKDGEVGEFNYVVGKGWSFYRSREDKEVPNYVTTVINVMESMINNFSYEDFRKKVIEEIIIKGQ